jgi:hypothetical protein
VIRAQTLSLRRRDYVAAAREVGEPTWRIICFEIMPNQIGFIAASFVGTVLYAILAPRWRWPSSASPISQQVELRHDPVLGSERQCGPAQSLVVVHPAGCVRGAAGHRAWSC